MGRYTGTSGADTITPTTVSAGVVADPLGSKPSVGADQIYGLEGADHLDGGAGGDTISAGAGDDIVDDYNPNRGGNPAGSPNSGNLIHGNAGNDSITIGMPTFVAGGNPSNNVVYGDNGNDSINIYYSVDIAISGQTQGESPSGHSFIHGGAGNDNLRATIIDYGQSEGGVSKASVSMYGDAGNDTLWATSWAVTSARSDYAQNNYDYLYGGSGSDNYHVFETKDYVTEKFGQGYDTITAIQTDYILPANVEKLVLTFPFPSSDSPPPGLAGTGNALDNVIIGTEFDDRLKGAGGNDTIFGSAHGGYGDLFDKDIIHGDAGNDLICGASGKESDQDGADKLYGDAGNDRIFGQFGDDLIYGGTGNDSLAGQAGNDTLWGGAGNDHLGGGTGNDMLYGEDGADALTGRQGADTLSGGGGTDRFVYEDLADSKPGAGNHDTILDMAGIGVAGGDRIDLHQIDADATKGGNQAFVFVSSTAALKAGQLHVVAGGGTDSLVQGEVDGKAGVDFEIMVHDGATKPGDWTAGDFIL